MMCVCCSAEPVSRHGRRLGLRCYYRAKATGTLLDWPRVNRSADEVLSDVAVLRVREPGITVRAMAAQLGMTHQALSRALQRARARERRPVSTAA
jgi:hypothetical protein